MSKTISKFPLRLDVLDGKGRASLEMPRGARLLTACDQGADICVFAEHDPDAPNVARAFRVFGTGEAMPDEPGAFVGTVTFYNGGLVLHVYEETSAGAVITLRPWVAGVERRRGGDRRSGGGVGGGGGDSRGGVDALLTAPD